MVINVSINWIWGFWKGAGISKEHFSWLSPADMAALQWDSGGKTDPAVVRLERAGSGESEGRVGGGLGMGVRDGRRAKQNKDCFIAIQKIIWLSLHKIRRWRAACRRVHVCLCVRVCVGSRILSPFIPQCTLLHRSEFFFFFLTHSTHFDGMFGALTVT